MRSVDEVKLIDEGPLDARAYSFIATHLFGAARMGPDPKASVVGLDFSTHDARGLYVVDSSVFPTNLGVNPQHSDHGRGAPGGDAGGGERVAGFGDFCRLRNARRRGA